MLGRACIVLGRSINALYIAIGLHCFFSMDEAETGQTQGSTPRSASLFYSNSFRALNYLSRLLGGTYHRFVTKTFKAVNYFTGWLVTVPSLSQQDVASDPVVIASPALPCDS
jgi:hypothetical protein